MNIDYELEEMFADGATDEEIGEYMWEYHRKEFNGKFFAINGKQLYPIIEDENIIGWELD